MQEWTTMAVPAITTIVGSAEYVHEGQDGPKWLGRVQKCAKRRENLVEWAFTRLHQSWMRFGSD